MNIEFFKKTGDKPYDKFGKKKNSNLILNNKKNTLSPIFVSREQNILKNTNNYNDQTNENNDTINNDNDITNNSIYLLKMNEFCNIMNKVKEDVLSNPKEEFRYFCFRYLDYIRCLDLPQIKQNNYYETVLIEFRCLPHLEFLIRNTIHKLGSDWSHSIICGNLNYDFMLNIVKKIDRDIKVIKTNYENIDASIYSIFLSSSKFWNLLTGEKILIYQEDAIIFKNNIMDFIEYDYIGAPSSEKQNDTANCVGNGGLSLRSKTIMLEIISKIGILETKYNSSTTNYMKKANLTIPPEDVYFSKNMLELNIGKIADWDTAYKFSSESFLNKDSFGGHDISVTGYLGNNIFDIFLWKKMMYQLIKNINYISHIYYIKPYNNPTLKDISYDLLYTYPNYCDNIFMHENEILKMLPRGTHIKKEIIDISLLEKFILIVDFNNNGGGTSFFIESIVSKYKNYHTFVIVRNNFNNIYFTVNDEYEFETFYNDLTAYELLLNNINKIEKIFVNHILNHTQNFINRLFDLKVQIDTITHDYIGIFGINNIQPKFNDINNILNNNSDRCYVDINKYDHIITQNQGNLYIYDKFIEDKNKIIISPLPDYQKTQKLIKTKNNNIVIGIIGLINDIKGLNVLNNIIKYYKKTNHVKFIVFGEANIYSFTNVFRYNNIDELNNLLTIHKPNILIELSLWPETYSYTLSLSMITMLPIIYLKKNNYCPVESRLSKYYKAYSFTTIEEFNKLINDNKQDYFYTIEPFIYFNKFWDEYFQNINTQKFNILSTNIDDNINNYNHNVIKQDILNKNIVLITSKIVVSNNSYTYTKIRSIYTIDERFSQTLHTIYTIRNKIPNAYIVLVDNSKLNEYQINTLKEKTDYFINITDNKEINYYTDDCEIKLFGELSQQLVFYKYFLSKIDISKLKHFFKLSGRYYINDTFDYQIYDNNLTIFKKNNTVTDREYYYTSFYKISIYKIIDYFKILSKIMNEKNKYTSLPNDFEVIVPGLIDNKVIISNLGITQIISCWNIIDNI